MLLFLLCKSAHYSRKGRLGSHAAAPAVMSSRRQALGLSVLKSQHRLSSPIAPAKLNP